MTQAQFWIAQRAWACKWLDTPADKLPGTLTHAACLAKLTEAEDALIGLERYDAYGRMTGYVAA